jgi:hypothetical protein
VTDLDAVAGPEATALAIGWATVELDRAAQELAVRLPPGAAFVVAMPSIVLGARCLVASASRPGDPRLVLLEPSTEGRLAAALARHGEGWLVTWSPSPAGATATSGRGDVDIAWRPGPLGDEALQPDPPVWGPYRLWLSPATIEP